jgi:prepilin-type N-terminal cleavage/methylation domain-containing protein
MFPNRKAFTLVEMLVALAVSSIVIIATYASYDMVKTQYEKNIDIADTHTSGRAVMRIIERDIRMAGYEHRDSSGNKTFSTGISNQLVLSESDNACCDGVSVIYDHPTDTVDGVERRRITYSVREFPGTEDVSYRLLDSDTARYRLYKKIDVLGRDGTILPAEESGTEQVLADFVEDFQLFNIEKSRLLIIGQERSGEKIWVYDVDKKTTNKFGDRGVRAFAIDSNGLLWTVFTDRFPTFKKISVYDPSTKKLVSETGIPNVGNSYGIDFGLRNNLFYIGQMDFDLKGKECFCTGIYDVKTKKMIGSINTGDPQLTKFAIGPDGMLYGPSNWDIKIFNPVSKKKIGALSITDAVSSYGYGGGLEISSNGLLYIGLVHGSYSLPRVIAVFDIYTRKFVKTIPIPGSRMGSIGGIAINEDDGLIYVASVGQVQAFDAETNKMIFSIKGPSVPSSLEFKNKKSGKESLVNIKLTLRSKNKQHTKDKTYTKESDEEHHVGNYNFEFNDKYKRDVFFSTVAVRNMLL